MESEFDQVFDQVRPYIPYAIAGIVTLIFLIWVILLDSDLNLFIKRWLGRRPTSLRNKVIWITGESFCFYIIVIVCYKHNNYLYHLICEPGASSGIGAKLALELARSGVRLAISATRVERLEEVKKLGLEGK